MKKKLFLIIVLILIIIGTIGYNIYNNLNYNESISEVQYDDGVIEVENDSNEKSIKANNSDEEIFDIDNYQDEVKRIKKKKDYVIENEKLETASDFMKSISSFVEYTYLKDRFTVDDISNDEKISYSIRKELAFKKNIIETEMPSNDSVVKYQSAIRWDTIQQRAKLFFGENVEVRSVDKVNVDIPGVGCYVADKYCYNRNCNDYFYLLDKHGCDIGWKYDYFKTKDISGSKKENEYEVVMKVLRINCNPTTNTCDIIKTGSAEILGKEKNDNVNKMLDSYFSKANSFKYIFKLENGRYHFDHSEIIK